RRSIRLSTTYYAFVIILSGHPAGLLISSPRLCLRKTRGILFPSHLISSACSIKTRLQPAPVLDACHPSLSPLATTRVSHMALSIPTSPLSPAMQTDILSG